MANYNNKREKEKPICVEVLLKDSLAEVGSERLRVKANQSSELGWLRWGYYQGLKKPHRKWMNEEWKEKMKKGGKGLKRRLGLAKLTKMTFLVEAVNLIMKEIKKIK